MALLKKLKSLFGLDDESQPESSRDVGVTVEKERQAEAATESTAEDDDDGSTTEHTTDEGTDAEPGPDPTAGEAESEPAEDGAGSAQEAASTQEAPESAQEESEPVEEIKGIGPAYADRLGSLGIETIADLAAADPGSVASETDISETRVEEWVKRAKARS